MDRPRYIEDLADELLSNILSFILVPERQLDDSPPTHHQPSSLGINGNPAPSYGEKSDLDRFRLVCKRFMRIGAPHKFHRYVLRFSKEGFQRLEDFLNMQLACHVRYFTYMVRPFYQGSGWPLIFQGVDVDDLPDSELHDRRHLEQRFLTETHRDLLLLRRAIAAFSSLQQVKLLRLQDAADEQLLDYLRDRPLEETTSFNWDPACTRAVTSLGAALLESNRGSIRFIGPQISPEATVRLLQVPSATLSAVGARLTSLDVNFHSTIDMTASMESLSSVFHGFFLAARNLVTIHLGFPARIPLDLKLEHIFHRVQWKRLRTLGIQGWRLSSEELIAFVRRHRRQLHDLRLLSIYLRDDGGRWQDVLSVLHDEMENLERLDLREIDYAAHFDADTMFNGNGGEVFETSTLSLGIDPILDSPPPSQAFFTDETHMSILPHNNNRRPLPDALLERLRGLEASDLGDDGVSVKREQRILWEAWVLLSPRNYFYRS